MLNIGVGPHDLLQYHSRYGVLICRECQYAIQKSALQSHLLRHKIYRGDRQRLLSSISRLDIFEPDKVPFPNPASPPIDALPIISGYCCTADACGNLCASFKRMKRHWSETHGLSDPSNSSIARSVKLQTFFRGTKLRYFEVNFSPALGTTAAEQPSITDDDELQGKGGPDVDAVASKPQFQPCQPPKEPVKSSLVGVDLDTLKYFHHFTTITSLTLPSAEPSHTPARYWQTLVVFQALQKQWLMCGLLAISACHLASLADDETTAQAHFEKSKPFFSKFCAGWEGIPDHHSAAEEDTKKAASQIRRILRCAYSSLSATLGQVVIPELKGASHLQFIIATISALCPPETGGHDDNIQAETYAQAKRILAVRSSLESTSGDHIHTALLNCLRELPSRIAQAFGKPNNVQDVLATLSAIAALAECCDTSFASDEAEVAWQSMAKWILAKIPDHFHDMVSCHSPAALVVVAYWAASLVRRAENCGCWFLKGSTKTILLQISELLSADNLVQSLVEVLMS